MAKWYGIIGFSITEETKPGVWTERIVEREYYGDVLNNGFRVLSSENLTDDINVSNKISVMSEPFANAHYDKMRYIEFMGAKWKITNVEVSYPRLILTMGGVYNGG